jgi:hypothetical protein
VKTVANLTLQGRNLPVRQVAAIPAGNEAAALRAIQKNGADDVVFKLGNDTFVASGRGLALKNVKPNDEVTFEGRTGRVLSVDTELNSFKEGILAWPGLAVGGVVGTFGMAGFVQGLLAGANMAGLGVIIAAGGLALGLAINLVPAAYGAWRKVSFGAQAD